MTPTIRMFSERSLMCVSAVATEQRKRALERIPDLLQVVFSSMDSLHDEITDDTVQYKQLLARSQAESRQTTPEERKSDEKSLKQTEWDERFLGEDLQRFKEACDKMRKIAGSLLGYNRHTLQSEKAKQLKAKSWKRNAEIDAVLESIKEQISRLQGLEIETLKLCRGLETFLHDLPDNPDEMSVEALNTYSDQMDEGRKQLSRMKHELNMVPPRLLAWRELEAVAKAVQHCAKGTQAFFKGA